MKHRFSIFKWILLLTITIFSFELYGQSSPDFIIEKQVKTTPVTDQANTGTCWSFATISFLESEMMRMGKAETRLSEMYIVKNVYTEKAKKYIRFQKKNNFSQGGQAHDVINAMKFYGIVPYETYTGLRKGFEQHDHSILEKSLLAYVDSAVIKIESKKIEWQNGFNQILDSLLGVVPVSFKYKNNIFTPQSFLKDVVGINPDDYVEITSFSHHPFYTQFDLEIPDNWSHDRYYNVPIDDLIKIMDNSFQNGYSVAWDGDVSERTFSHRSCKATVSDADMKQINELGMQKYRQITFDNYSTTDDHLMHATGIAKGATDGKKYYMIKNSWGSSSNKCGGYLYMSEDYARLKTICILVHKDAIPKDIAKKMKL